MQVADYFDAVFQIIRTNQRPNGLKASTLGQLILRSLPKERWTNYGFPTLKSLLQDLQQRRLIRIGEDHQGVLAVWPVDSAIVKSSAASPAGSISQKYNPLRNQVWLAFVAPQPQGRRFANRLTGGIRMGLSERPHPADQWTEITPVPDSEQKNWAREFIRENHLADAQLEAILERITWFNDFRYALRERNAELAHAWNRTRSEKVSGLVRHWCEEHKLDPELVFEQKSIRSPQHPTCQPTTASKNQDVRSVVLGALARMTTDELMQIPIPSKYILKELGLQ